MIAQPDRERAEALEVLTAHVQELQTRLTTLESLRIRDELRDAGYQQRQPGDGRPAEVTQIDLRVCRESRCDACEHEGLQYELWWHSETRSYRAFAVCPQCGSREEF